MRNENVRHRIATGDAASSARTTVFIYAGHGVVISGVLLFVAALLNDSFIKTVAGSFAVLMVGLTVLMIMFVRSSTSTQTEG